MTEEEELRTQCTARLTRVVSASFSPLIPSSVETCERAAEPFCIPLAIYVESELSAIERSLSGSGGSTSSKTLDYKEGFMQKKTSPMGAQVPTPCKSKSRL